MNLAEELTKYREILTEKNCKFCNKPVELIPSAVERARRDVTGKSASYYTSLFPNHAECELANRKKGDSDLMARKRKEAEDSKIVLKTPVREDEDGKFVPRSYKEPRDGVETHQTTLPNRVEIDKFEFVSSTPGKTEPNSVYSRYSNNKDKETGENEFVITKYDRLTNEVEVVHTGGMHLPVYYDFSTPEAAQKYLNRFNIKLGIGKGYIK